MTGPPDTHAFVGVGPAAGWMLGTTLVAIFLVVFGTQAPAAQRQASAPTTGRAVPREPIAAGTRLDARRAAAWIEADRRRLDYLPGEVVVKFRAGTSVDGQRRALRALRGRPEPEALTWDGDVARLVDPAEPDARALAATLALQPEVEYVHPNYVRRLPAEAAYHVRPVRVAPAALPAGAPSDPDYAELQWNFSLIGMPDAWDINPGGTPEVVVAVVDTGLTTEPTVLTRPLWVGQQFEPVDLRFEVSPDLSRSRVTQPRDFAFEPGARVLDFQGHGTHVASTIAEDANNAISLAGMAYNVRILPVKVCVGFWELMIARAEAGVPGYVAPSAGGCASEDIAAGIRYAADQGADVINLSLGGTHAAAVERDAILYAISKGAFVAASVGNRYERGNAPEFPAAFADDIPGLMAVAALGKSQKRAHYSSTGGHVEIAAPGGDDRDGGGEDRGYVWQVTLYPPDQDVFWTSRPRFDRYVEVGYEGTSMAAPHVSALAALLVSQGVTNPRAIEALIKATALDLGPTGRDQEFGHGLIQPRMALFGEGIR